MYLMILMGFKYSMVLVIPLIIGMLYSWNMSVARGLMSKLIPQSKKCIFKGFYSSATYIGAAKISFILFAWLTFFQWLVRFSYYCGFSLHSWISISLFATKTNKLTITLLLHYFLLLCCKKLIFAQSSREVSSAV